ncbi:MAG: pyrroline-5-carboxylate reductase [Gammaproteobacteria bacterium]|nr:pyrroline-5-carboxylate reductase [Gammaproteobacteria bacterium]
MTETIAFIGGGNMAASLIGGLVASGHEPGAIAVVDTDRAKADALGRQYGISNANSATEAVRDAQAVVLAIKPQALQTAVHGLSFPSGSAVISIAAGIRIDSLRRWLGPQVQIVRSMPNTPALYRAGMSGLYAPPETQVSAREAAQYVLGAVGETCWVETEPMLDALTAVSGSGPAYVFQLCEMMCNAGIALGLPADTARQLATHTIAGAARMLSDSDEDAEALRLKVTSKGGTTAAAIESLENGGVRKLYNAALECAARRAAELGDELDRS